MIGPLRQRWFLPSRQKGQAFRKAASPARPPGRRANARHSLANLDHPRTELMTEKLHGSFRLQPAFDALEREGRDAEGKLGLGYARLDAKRLSHHVPGRADRVRHLVEPHVSESVEPPGFHVPLLCRSREFLKRMASRRNRAQVAAGRPDDFADIEVAARIEANVVGCEEVARRARIRPSAPSRQRARLRSRRCSRGRRWHPAQAAVVPGHIPAL